MRDILIVYEPVSMQFDESGDIIVSQDAPMIHTISCDEKTGIQAVATASEGLRPSGKNSYIYRDYEYKRLGTLSLIAGLDLLTGETIPVVSETPKSSNFINLLKTLMRSVRKEISFGLYVITILLICQKKSFALIK